MHSKESLSTTKYGELLKIAKSLGIKGGRQKTEKLIQNILDAQNAEQISNDSSLLNDELLDDMKLPNNSFSSFNSSMDSDTGNTSLNVSNATNVTVTNIRRTKRGQRNCVSSKPVNVTPSKESIIPLSDSANEKETCQRNVSISQSGSKKRKWKQSPELKDEVDKPVRRSETFKVIKRSLEREKTFELSQNEESASENVKAAESPSKKRKRSNDSDTNENSSLTRRKRSSIIPTMGQPAPVLDLDLSCSEIQTAQDILYIEDDTGNVDKSPTNSSVPKSRSMRRSLRGQLLESRLSVHERISIIKQSEKILEVSEDNAESNVPSQIEQDSSSDPSFTSKPTVSPQTTSTEEIKEGKEEKSTNEMTVIEPEHNEDGNESSNTPRFVSAARRIRKARMPNFAKIHEKAFKRMEALDEYVDRKRTTKTPTSIAKPTQFLKNSTGRKEIPRFNPSVLSTNGMSLNFTGSDAKKTPMTFGMRRSGASTARKVSPAEARVVLSKRISTNPPTVTKNAPVISSLKPKIIAKKPSPKIVNKENKLKPSALPRLIKKDVPPTTSATMVSWNKGVKDPMATPGSLQRRKSYNPRFSHGTDKPEAKLPPKVVPRRDILKKMAERNPKVKSSTELRKVHKVYIKGVRTNKRFELQMANRKIH